MSIPVRDSNCRPFDPRAKLITFFVHGIYQIVLTWIRMQACRTKGSPSKYCTDLVNARWFRLFTINNVCWLHLICPEVSVIIKTPYIFIYDKQNFNKIRPAVFGFCFVCFLNLIKFFLNKASNTMYPTDIINSVQHSNLLLFKHLFHNVLWINLAILKYRNNNLNKNF